MALTKSQTFFVLNISILNTSYNKNFGLEAQKHKIPSQSEVALKTIIIVHYHLRVKWEVQWLSASDVKCNVNVICLPT